MAHLHKVSSSVRAYFEIGFVKDHASWIPSALSYWCSDRVVIGSSSQGKGLLGVDPGQGTLNFSQVVHEKTSSRVKYFDSV